MCKLLVRDANKELCAQLWNKLDHPLNCQVVVVLQLPVMDHLKK